MKNRQKVNLRFGVLGVILGALLSLSLACGADDTATPAAPAEPAPAGAPTAAPAMVPTLIPGAPTPEPVQPTPTRVLPTPTPVAMGQPQYGGALLVAGDVAPRFATWDVHYASGTLARPGFQLLYNQLVGSDSQGNVVPELARSWDLSADGKDMTFHLQEDVIFHNGEVFNAAVVKWNLDRLLDPEGGTRYGGEYRNFLDRVDVLDEYTVTFRLKQAFRPFLATLATNGGYMMPPKAYTELGGGIQGDYGKNPSGTGPFRLDSWKVGDHAKVVRNADYWEKGLPYLDSVKWLHVPDSSIAIAMIRTGEAHMGGRGTVKARHLPLIESNPRLKVDRLLVGPTVTFDVRIEQEPWSNQDLRLALAHVIDRETLAEVFYGGGAIPAYAIGTVEWAHDPDLKSYQYDLSKARDLVNKAGYPSGITTPIWCSGTAEFIEFCEIIKVMAEPAGIDLEIRLVPAGERFSRFAEGTSALTGPSRWSPRLDPHIRLFALYHSEGSYRGSDFIKAMAHAGLDRLIEDAATEYDTAKARTLYREIQSLAALNGWQIFLVYESAYMAMDKAVQGFEWYPDTYERLKGVWLDR